MSSSKKAILIVGTGPLISSSIAAHFLTTQEISHIGLISRTSSSLESQAAKLQSLCPSAKIKTWAVDVSFTHDYKKVLEEVKREYADILEVVVFNATRVRESIFGKETEETISHDLAISVNGLYTTATTLCPVLQESKSPRKPTFFLTSGLLALKPSTQHFALSICKAAQHNLTQTIREIYGPKGVNVVEVLVGGVVGKGNGALDPGRIAEVYGRAYVDGLEKGEKEIQILEGP